MKDKQELQKDRIIQAAMKVLYEQGLNEMTFRNVAAEAGMSPGTLYYYYNSKDLILYDILNQNIFNPFTGNHLTEVNPF